MRMRDSLAGACKLLLAWQIGKRGDCERLKTTKKAKNNNPKEMFVLLCAK